MDGLLNIWKPSGPTSFDVVRRLRRAGADRRVGHGGTLDPLAEGVLPVLCGQGTRLAELLEDCAKTYRATVLLGVETDTLDVQGQVLRTGDASRVGIQDIQASLPAFVGRILQHPPAYSALKREGQPLYKLARQGVVVQTDARPVHIHSITLLSCAPPRVTLEVVCGRGTYIRSLAADIGYRLGCGATLESLARLRVGPFRGEEATSLEIAETAFRDGQGGALLLPLGILFSDWPALFLSAAALPRALSGSLLGPDDGIWGRAPSTPAAAPPHTPAPPTDRAVAYSPERRLVALLTLQPGGLWHPDKVFLERE